MLRDERGRTVLVCLVLLVMATLGGALSGLYAANNEPPDGWFMSNRTRAKWAMGRTVAYLAHASANNTLPATGLAATDTVNAIIDVETAGAWALLPITTTLTLAANSITSSGTPYTQGSMYLVIAHRPQASDR